MTLINKSDVTFEPVKGGIHAGGQHAQKNATGVRATHEPSGLVVVIRGRSLAASKRRAMQALREKVNQMAADIKGSRRKERWVTAIKSRDIIRTYNYTRNQVVDHRTGAQATVKDVLQKGKLELVMPMSPTSWGLPPND